MQTSNVLTEAAIQEGLLNLRAAIERGRLPFLILVEDDDLDANLFRSALRQAGVSVEFMRFDDARQAIDFFHGRGDFADRDMYPLPKLTVLDWNLPRSSGLEILEEIRSDPSLDQLTVIALSASSDMVQIAKARRLRINEWIQKPESLADLVTVARQIRVAWLDDSKC